MNNSTSETTTEEAMADIQPSETPSLESAAVETQPEVQSVEMQPAEVQHDFQPLDLRRRLRELLSVPERDRSDEVWDEIIELEIQLAPGNRIATNETQGGGARQHQGRQGKPQPSSNASSGAAGAQQKKHRPRAKTNRRPRQGGKPSGGAGGGDAV